MFTTFEQNPLLIPVGWHNFKVFVSAIIGFNELIFIDASPSRCDLLFEIVEVERT